jgi:hypothetical protein
MKQKGVSIGTLLFFVLLGTAILWVAGLVITDVLTTEVVAGSR